MNKNIIIEIKGGVVTDVRNLPDGYTYEIQDHDTETEHLHVHNWDNYGKCMDCKFWDVKAERLK